MQSNVPDIIYIHTGTDTTHAELLWVALLSAHLIQPDSSLRCLVPEDDLAALEAMVPALLRGTFEWVPLAVPEGTPGYRNRWIKLQFPRWLRGPSLYLDSDTLIVRPLDWGICRGFHFATTRNRDSDGFLNPISSKYYASGHFERAGWSWVDGLEDDYRNGGVFFVQPGADADRLFGLWFDRWQAYHQASGSHLDQPALNLTLHEANWKEQLPDSWNAPVFVLPKTARGACIYHYYFSGICDKLEDSTLLRTLQAKLRSGELSKDAAAALLRSGKPYHGPGARARAYFEAGQYGWAVRAMAKKYLSRLTARSH